MAIYDCFQFFNEEHILDLRLNILDKFVDFFVIVESTTDHQGKTKKLYFESDKFKKFQKKIIYIVVDDTEEAIKKPHFGGESLVEQHQRNSVMKGLKNCEDDDLIIISDVDQMAFAYKLNLINEAEHNWHGSKMCLKKHLKSPQWLRNLKFKKYSFWRIDKPKRLQIIPDAGWHFAYLLKAEDISKKIQSFAHGEFNSEDNRDVKKIQKKMTNLLHPTRGFELKKVEIDHTFPKYILENKEKLKEWII